MHLLNSFSLGMLPEGFGAAVKVRHLDTEGARAWLGKGFVSAVGHADTAAVFESELGVPVAFNRVTVAIPMGKVWRGVVGQYVGPRLPEGTKTLPLGSSIKWILVTVQAY